MSLFYRIVSLWCVLGVFCGGLVVVDGHSRTTRTFECKCWDAHTHSPTPAPRVMRRIIFPSPKSRRRVRPRDSSSSDDF